MKNIIPYKTILLFLVFCSFYGAMAQPKAGVESATECGCEARPLPDVLAVINGAKFTKNDFSESTAQQIRKLHEQVIDARKRELDLIINSKLLNAEAKKRNITTTELLEREVTSKVKEPTEAEVQAFYEQNKTKIGRDFSTVKNDLIVYMREERQRQAAKNFAQVLRSAADVKLLVEFATPPATNADRNRVFAYVNSEPIRSSDIENNLLALISSVQKQMYSLRKNDIDLKINDLLLEQEAQKRKITTKELLVLEVNSKVPNVSEAEAQTFYNQNKDRINGSFAETKNQIIAYLQEEKNREAQLAFAAKLRGAASIQMFLTAPETALKNQNK